MGFPCGSAGKESACHVRDLVSSLGQEDPLEKGKANPLQYSGLENSMDYAFLHANCYQFVAEDHKQELPKLQSEVWPVWWMY